jgi:hypothetical protein
MAESVEESSCGRAALLEIIWLRTIDDGLPVMVIFHSNEAVVDTREFARGVKFFGRFNPRIGRCFGIEDPTGGLVM